MKLLDIIKTFFSHGTFGYELLFHIYKNPAGYKLNVPHESHNRKEVPDEYLDYSCHKVKINGQISQIEFYLTENDEDF